MGRSQDSFNKREREKKRRKKKQEKAERKSQRKEEGIKGPEFMYADEFGNLSATPPDPTKRTEVKAEDIDLSNPRLIKREEEEVSGLRGTVKFFNEEKGYGFIDQDGSKKSYFVHANNLTEPLKDGDKVTFEVEPGPKGPVAVNVSKI